MPASASISYADVGKAWYARPDQLPDDVSTAGLEVTEGYKPDVDTGLFSYATHAARVAVDAETGLVEILDYVIVEDCGRMVNPMIVGGPGARRCRAGCRHRAVRGMPVRCERPAAGLDADGLSAAGAERIAELPRASYRDAVAAFRARHQGRWRGRRDRSGRRAGERDQRCAGPARRRAARHSGKSERSAAILCGGGARAA